MSLSERAGNVRVLRRAITKHPAVLILLLTGCVAVGPNYQRPQIAVPTQFRETGPWRSAAPSDLDARGSWWEVFGDPVLNALERQAKETNFGLRAAAARVEQAHAIAGIAGSFLAPELNFNPSAARYGVSKNRPDQPSKQPSNTAYAISDYRVPLYASYELDIWGRMRRQNEAAENYAKSSIAAYQTVLLTLEGDIAQTYFLIRASDEDARILRDNIGLREHARDLIAARRKNGLSNDLDLAKVETELAIAKAEAESTSKRRDELELSLAVLIGAQPENFNMKPAPYELRSPIIPTGLPSDLLERRPDVAEAERRLIARNAEIGVAKSAYFPSIRLTAAVGVQSFELGNLLNQDSTIWTIGASVWQPVFNSGRIGFDVKRAKAAYAENLAIYRERILKAFQEVESSLSGLRHLAQQSEYQLTAMENATKATTMAMARFKGGLVPLIDAIDAQRVSLATQRQALQVTSSQVLTTVALIKSLGGGWGSKRLTQSDSPSMSASVTTNTQVK